MNDEPVLVGVVIDEQMLSLEELACACGVSVQWLQHRLDTGLLGCCGGEGRGRRFASPQLRRARRLRAIEQDFDANPELAALVVDLLEEIQKLRGAL